jgi:hypothetical protein
VKESQSTAGVAAALLLLPVIYVGGYLALLHPEERAIGRDAYYRVGGKSAAWVFYPLHQIDRRLRPDYWG